MRSATATLRRRHLPYVGQTVTVEWTGNDAHRRERIEHGFVVNAGPRTLWIHAPAAGVKVEQDVFIKYDQIRLIQEEHLAGV